MAASFAWPSMAEPFSVQSFSFLAGITGSGLVFDFLVFLPSWVPPTSRFETSSAAAMSGTVKSWIAWVTACGATSM